MNTERRCKITDPLWLPAALSAAAEICNAYESIWRIFDGAGRNVSAAAIRLKRTMTVEEVKAIVQKYVDSWNAAGNRPPLWVVLAEPGEDIRIPHVTFGSRDKPSAGMELPVHAHLIVLHKGMRPESLLPTFLHEFGHAQYRVSVPEPFDHVASEVAAIAHSLESLARENLDDLAYQEARAIVEMSSAEPYRSAIQRLASHQLWVKYSRSG